MAALLDLLLGIIANFLTKLIERSPRWIASGLNKLPQKSAQPVSVQIFPIDCGNKGISLAQQKLLISTTFGPYFADLLERDHAYVDIASQIDSPFLPGHRSLAPIQRIFATLQHPKGHRIVLIAADGGMGKSTLAARIVRCLYHEHGVDMILGDSAKRHTADVLTGKIRKLASELYDDKSLVERLCSQLGIPLKSGHAGQARAQQDIRDRLAGRRAIIVVDNLESVGRSDKVLRFLRTLASRDVRIVLTSRHESGLASAASDVFVVHLKPVTDVTEITHFLAWHISTYSSAHPDLEKLSDDLGKRKKMQLLADRTGGVPLIMQLLASDIARSSWQAVDQLPQLFGSTLLTFLYAERWKQLSLLGSDGQSAKKMLAWVAEEQLRERTITYSDLVDWASLSEIENLDDALRILFERFLIINNDSRKGRFFLFPSLVEFLRVRDLREEGL